MLVSVLINQNPTLFNIATLSFVGHVSDFCSKTQQGENVDDRGQRCGQDLPPFAIRSGRIRHNLHHHCRDRFQDQVHRHQRTESQVAGAPIMLRCCFSFVRSSGRRHFTPNTFIYLDIYFMCRSGTLQDKSDFGQLPHLIFGARRSKIHRAGLAHAHTHTHPLTRAHLLSPSSLPCCPASIAPTNTHSAGPVRVSFCATTSQTGKPSKM